MKKVILTLAAIVSLASCEKAPTTTEIAEQAVVESLLDPQSWEGISTEITDSLTQYDVMDELLGGYNEIAMKYINQAKEALEMGNLMSSPRNIRKYLNEAEAASKVSQKIIDENINPLKEKMEALKGTENDTLVKVLVKVNGYATSRDGQRRIGTFEVEMSPNNEVLSTKSI